MQETYRTKHTYQTYIYAFVKDILVVCPSCSGKAIVQTGNFVEMPFEIKDVRAVCPSCGFNKQFGPISMNNKSMVFGAPTDPFFRFPVWLQTDFEGQTLWAYNVAHLDFLEAHVGAKLRERNGQPHKVRSIGARLPRWMTNKHNRASILKQLDLLRLRI